MNLKSKFIMLPLKILQCKTVQRLDLTGFIFIRSATTYYVQGQSPEPKIREYFYYIDHQGMLFLDDAKMKNFTSCFKDKQFLVFFFRRLRKNNTGRYSDFPYLSVCGREKNYIRCDDCPIVFTHVINSNNEDRFCYNHTGDSLYVPFEPDKIYMEPNSGRVYHPGPINGGSIGLVMSKLAIEFSKLFTFQHNSDAPTHFTWNGVNYNLSSEWFHNIKR